MGGIFAGVSAGCVVALLALPVQAAPAPVRVSMKDFAFVPATVTVVAGQSVSWTYDEVATDPMPNCESPYFQLGVSGAPGCPGHSTTAVTKNASGAPLWDSGVKRANGFPFSYTFTTAGTYHYICTVHGGAAANNPVTHMEGDVVVQAAPATQGASGSGSSAAGPSVAAAGATRTLPLTGIAETSLSAGALALLLVAWMLGSRRGSRSRA
jgi:plastocyanin